jgi:hypothetical protein
MVPHPEPQQLAVARQPAPTRPGRLATPALASFAPTRSAPTTLEPPLGPRPTPIAAGARPIITPLPAPAAPRTLVARTPLSALIVAAARPRAVPPRACAIAIVVALHPRLAARAVTIIAPIVVTLAPTLHAPLDLHTHLVVAHPPITRPLLAPLGRLRAIQTLVLGERVRGADTEQQGHQAPRQELLHNRSFRCGIASD